MATNPAVVTIHPDGTDAGKAQADAVARAVYASNYPEGYDDMSDRQRARYLAEARTAIGVLRGGPK